ncbi:U4/U6.U5 small nuclear ribonucleoprotein [Borealophlyctis nickersoniae]|nr:U4/U6.U5 small nuclear ribonucleoprotein [Borealophlyctis nickersoniae]
MLSRPNETTARETQAAAERTIQQKVVRHVAGHHVAGHHEALPPEVAHHHRAALEAAAHPPGAIVIWTRPVNTKEDRTVSKGLEETTNEERETSEIGMMIAEIGTMIAIDGTTEVGGPGRDHRTEEILVWTERGKIEGDATIMIEIRGKIYQERTKETRMDPVAMVTVTEGDGPRRLDDGKKEGSANGILMELDELDEEEKMKALLGFSGFDSTKGKKVSGADASGVAVNKQRTYRQYMNRRRGFNRNLSPTR